MQVEPTAWEEETPNEPDVFHALARFAQQFDCKIVSENVDDLQLRSFRSIGMNDEQIENQFVAVHGTRDSYRCSDVKALTSDMLSFHNCPYATHEVVSGQKVKLSFAPETNRADSDRERRQLTEPPRCPIDHKPLMPAVLFADEAHTEHSIFRWDKAVRWANFADVLVFVQPSRSAAVEMMLRIGWRNSLTMFEINHVPPTGLAVESGVESIVTTDLNHTMASILRKVERRERFFVSQRQLQQQQQQLEQQQTQEVFKLQPDRKHSSAAVTTNVSSSAIKIPPEPKPLSAWEYLFRWIRMLLLDFVWASNQYLLYGLLLATGAVWMSRMLYAIII
jgi:hypothetical protein